MTEFQLTATDREAPLWRALSGHLTSRLASLREKNDSRQHDAAETAFLRGQIAEIKALLELAAERRPMKV